MDRKEQIVSAAIDRLFAVGFEGLRVSDVAKDVGINNATLIHHYRLSPLLLDHGFLVSGGGGVTGDGLTHSDRLSPGLRVGLALRYRGAVMAVRRRREHHPFPNGRQLSQPVVRCRQVWAFIHPREVGVCNYTSADCTGWARPSVPPRAIKIAARSTMTSGANIMANHATVARRRGLGRR
jgi:hypothetical protein